MRDEPLVRALSLLVLAAIAVGILQGYVARGSRTVSRYGMEDFGLFHASGRQFFDHGRLYGPLRRPGTTRLSQARNLNPPHATLLFLPFAMLPPGLGLQAWIVLNLLALLDIARIAVRELQLPLRSIRAAAAAVFLLAWAPTAALVITGQLALLVAWPLTRAWRAARHADWNRAGWWIGGAAALKVFLLVFVPYLALRRLWPAMWRAVLQLAALVALGALVCGPASYVEWTAQFADVTWYGHYMNASVWGLLERGLHGFRSIRAHRACAAPGDSPGVGDHGRRSRPDVVARGPRTRRTSTCPSRCLRPRPCWLLLSGGCTTSGCRLLRRPRRSSPRLRHCPARNA